MPAPGSALSSRADPVTVRRPCGSYGRRTTGSCGCRSTGRSTLLKTAAARLGNTPRLVPATARAFVDGLDARFGLAQSTFALHTMPHDERSAVLSALRPHVDCIAVVEFDVHDHAPDARLDFLADTYERGLSEYDTDRDLVAQGFLMPVLTGQLMPGAVRSTWEQPASAWVEQFTACGYEDVTAVPLYDYWSSPAFLLTARGENDPRQAEMPAFTRFSPRSRPANM